MKILRKQDVKKIDNVYADLEQARIKIESLEKQQLETIGSVFIATVNGNIFPASRFTKSDSQEKSAQLKDTNYWLSTQGLGTRPFDPYSFLSLYDENPTVYRVINQIATDAAGLGYKLVLKDRHKESLTEKQRIVELLTYPNDGKSTFRHIVNSLIIDYELIGYQALETIRGRGKQVTKMYHLPVCDLYVHVDGIKYCQKSGQSEVWFSDFSQKDTLKIKASDGSLQEDTASSDIAHEIYFNKMYYPRSKLYGAPPLVSAIGQVVSMIGIRDYNLSFFENLGIPAYLVTLSGKWNEKAGDEIHKFINTELKGAENANKTLVLQLPSGGQANFVPISTQAREGSFRLYLDSLKEDVLAVYSMPPYRIGIAVVGKLSGSTARELNEIYKNGVIEPVQDEIEKMMNDVINSPNYAFKFIDLDTNDKMLDMSLETQALNTGRVSINDLKVKAGEEKLKDKWASQHFISRSMIPLELMEENIKNVKAK